MRRKQKILVTGAAGFIGYHLCLQLAEVTNWEIVGLDNLNDYYDVSLKKDRLSNLGFSYNLDFRYGKLFQSELYKSLRFVKLNLQDKLNLPKLFKNENFDLVCNLAAQAGVRYSIKAPFEYLESNINGFLNLLECCKQYDIEKLIYASSSSVYGNSENVPYNTLENVDKPVSLYAATKKSNELMAHVYSSMYGLKTIGLRFFTVYGPYGRPDMAVFLFTNAIKNEKPIEVFNNGNLSRDFTYIDDIITGLLEVITKEPATERSNYMVYNIGNSKPIKLLDFISAIEKQTGKNAEIVMRDMQPGDVYRTWADISDFQSDYSYFPKTDIDMGIRKYTDWFREYYK